MIYKIFDKKSTGSGVANSQMNFIGRLLENSRDASLFVI